MAADSVVPLSKNVSRSIWWIIAVSLGFHIFCVIAGNTFWDEFSFAHEPIHACIEISGSLMAFVVALFLMSLEKRNMGTSYNTCIAGALFGMGILDGLHAMVHAGPAFIWLHSTATFFGGILFLAVWLPHSFQKRIHRYWPLAVAASILTFGLLSIAIPEMMLPMATKVDGEITFTIWAKLLNIVGGVFLFIAAIRLYITYRLNKNIDDLLFVLHCVLFGAAAIMFEQSELWDIPWWGWHLLRFAAYGTALYFVIRWEFHLQDVKHSNTEQEAFIGIFDNTPIGILMVNHLGNIKIINEQCATMFGYDSTELLDQPIEILVPDGIKPKHPDLRNAYFQAPDKRALHTGRQIQGQRKDGSLVDVEIFLNPLLSKNQLHVVASIVDISKRVESQHEIELVNEELRNFNTLLVGRELKMIELKKEIAELQNQLLQAENKQHSAEKENAVE